MISKLHQSFKNAADGSLAYLFVLLFALTFSIELFTLLYTPNFTMGDWLINYSAGFVRRGLPGQFFLITAHLFHVPVPWLALLFPVLLYAAFLVCVYRLANPLRHNFLLFALLFSPATLPFIVLNIHEIGVRKETLMLAALAAFALILQSGVADWILFLGLMVTVPILALSHEGTLICWPYFFCAAALGTHSLKRAFKICAVPLLTGLVLFAVVSRYPGNIAIAQGICASVGGHWVSLLPGHRFPGGPQSSLCSGSIEWLGISLDDYRQERLGIRFASPFAYIIPLAVVPFALAVLRIYRRDKLRLDAVLITATALISSAISVPLFLATINWGRWIYMQAVCLLIVILLAAHRAPSF